MIKKMTGKDGDKAFKKYQKEYNLMVKEMIKDLKDINTMFSVSFIAYAAKFYEEMENDKKKNL